MQVFEGDEDEGEQEEAHLQSHKITSPFTQMGLTRIPAFSRAERSKGFACEAHTNRNFREIESWRISRISRLTGNSPDLWTASVSFKCNTHSQPLPSQPTGAGWGIVVPKPYASSMPNANTREVTLAVFGFFALSTLGSLTTPPPLHLFTHLTLSPFTFQPRHPPQSR